MSTSRVSGSPGFIDPFVTNGLEHSELTDGFALGITMLMLLTGRVAVGLTHTCDEALEDPSLAPGLADEIAAWPASVAVELMVIAARLTTARKRNRMPLPDALVALRRAVDGHYLLRGRMPSVAECPQPASSSPSIPTNGLLDVSSIGSLDADIEPFAASGAASQPSAGTERLCMICEDKPREVRFECGHACCCRECLVLVLSKGLCPVCRTRLGERPLLEEGTHVATAPTFELGAPRPAGPAVPASRAPSIGRRGRGGRGRGGRGR